MFISFAGMIVVMLDFGCCLAFGVCFGLFMFALGDLTLALLVGLSCFRFKLVVCL